MGEPWTEPVLWASIAPNEVRGNLLCADVEDGRNTVSQFVRIAIFLVCLVCFSAVGDAFAATYYVDCASGSDSNPGTKVSPWKHAPAMPGASMSYNHAPGDQIIFKGGATCPVSDFTWTISNSGTSSTPDYYGVSASWYTGTNSGSVNTNAETVSRVSGNAFVTGTAWVGGTITINGSNYTIASVQSGEQLTLTTSAGTQSAVSYSNSLFVRPIFSGNNGSGPSGYFVQMNGNYITLDNIEFVGQEVPDNTCCSHMAIAMTGTGNVVNNAYIHGWVFPGGCTSTSDGHIGGIDAGTVGPNSVVDHLLFTGQDVSPPGTSGNAINDGGGNLTIQYSVAHDMSNGWCCGEAKAIHDTLLYNIHNSCGSFHENSIEDLSNSTRVAIYNNVIHDISSGTSMILCPNMDFYNNVIYEGSTGNTTPLEINGDSGCGSSAGISTNIYNNTWVPGGNSTPIIAKASGQTIAGTANIYNNHVIGGAVYDTGIGYASVTVCGSAGTGAPGSCELLQTISAATSAGYTATETNSSGLPVPYSPISSNSATVGIAVDLTSSCGSLTALCSDIWGVARPSSGAWDAGAYQFATNSSATPPNPPQNLTATVQ
jgi:hypothetical protein